MRELEDLLGALIGAIEAGELEADVYLLGYLRGALATLQSLRPYSKGTFSVSFGV